jgi:integrase
MAKRTGVERLTEKEIETATKSLCDGRGLWLAVEKKGNRYLRRWVFYYQDLGDPPERYTKKDGSPGAIKTREAVIGNAADINSRDTRDEAEKYRRWLKAKIDPISERLKVAGQAGYKVRTALKKYDDVHVSKQSKTYQDTLRGAMKYIEDRIGDYHPDICTPTFLIEKLRFQNISRGNRPHYWTVLMGLFDMAVFDRVIASNPAAKSSGIRRYVPKAEGVVVSHGEKAIPRERLWELMVAIRADKDHRGWDGLPERTISSYLTEFYLTTGIRISEVLDEAKWGVMDEAKGIWHVSKTKIGIKRDVPITPSMARVLQDVRKIIKAHGLPDGKNDPVFPKIEGKKTDGEPYGRQGIYTCLNKVCARNGLPATNLHALRTSLRGWGKFMKNRGCWHYPDLVELQLAHKAIGKVAQAYSAQDDDWPKRFEMMEAYDKFWCTPYADFLKESES